MKVFVRKNYETKKDENGENHREHVGFYVVGAEIPKITMKGQEIHKVSWEGKQFDVKTFCASQVGQHVAMHLRANCEIVIVEDEERPDVEPGLSPSSPTAVIPKNKDEDGKEIDPDKVEHRAKSDK